PPCLTDHFSRIYALPLRVRLSLIYSGAAEAARNEAGLKKTKGPPGALTPAGLSNAGPQTGSFAHAPDAPDSVIARRAYGRRNQTRGVYAPTAAACCSSLHARSARGFPRRRDRARTRRTGPHSRAGARRDPDADRRSPRHG